MKATLFLLLALIVCLVQSDSEFYVTSFLAFKNGLKNKAPRNIQATTCTKITCAKKGQSCLPSADLSTVPACVDESTFCHVASATSATCIELYNLNAACTDDNECKSNNCVSGKCAAEPVATVMLYNGQTCSTSAQCISGTCTGSVCVGKALNVSCFAGDECASEFCRNSACVAQATANTACDLDDNSGESTFGSPCVLGLVCVPRGTVNVTGLCIQEFTGASGSLCEDNLGCGEGLACIAGTCAAAVASTKKSCDSSVASSCGASEVCTCNYGAGSNICVSPYDNNPKGAKDASADVASCWTGNCKNDPTESCYLSKCKKQTCRYTKLQLDFVLASQGELYPKCIVGASDEYTQICSASILSTASVIAVAFLGVAALLF